MENNKKIYFDSKGHFIICEENPDNNTCKFYAIEMPLDGKLRLLEENKLKPINDVIAYIEENNIDLPNFTNRMVEYGKRLRQKN